jgi:hypothetical protein
MCCSCNGGASKDGLELGSGLKPVHWRRASARKQQGCRKTGLNSQTFAAFGATGSDHCAAATGFHAGQKAVRTGAFDFGRLVSAFHVVSYEPVSYKSFPGRVE